MNRKSMIVSLLLLIGLPLVALHSRNADAAKKESHADYAQMQIKECTNCHRGAGVTPNHGADWSREHRLMAEKAGNNCADCHQQSFCLDCHVGGGIEPDLSKSISRRGDYMPRTHLADFISLHPIKVNDNPQNCYRCHDAAYCFDCHSRMQKNTMNIKSHTRTQAGQQFIFTEEHAREARRNLQSCQTCHPEGNVCLPCHSAVTGFRVNPHPRNWSGGKLQSKGGDRSCRVCH